jgi:YfiH family protein
VFAFQDTQGPVEIAFTDRHGGSSGGPFASLNLAERSSDPPEVVQQNLAAVTRAFVGEAGLPLLRRLVPMHQVHGADVHVVDGADPGSSDAPVGDALVTRSPGVALMVRVADCVPVLLADPVAGVVAAAHAGRPGLAAGVVPATLAAMRELGAVDITAWVGPHVCGACYEVPARLREEVAAVVPASYAETSWGTPALDIGAGVLAQLLADDVQVHDASRCTVEDDDLFSYRRQGQASGRLAGLVWRRP